jgi:putative membrane protein
LNGAVCGPPDYAEKAEIASPISFAPMIRQSTAMIAALLRPNCASAHRGSAQPVPRSGGDADREGENPSDRVPHSGDPIRRGVAASAVGWNPLEATAAAARVERMSEPIAADVTERTTLAGERTLLAWWRTGLAGLAVAIAVGRVVPELSPASEEWPYTLLGIAYAVYGIALIVYGTARGRDVQVAAQRGELSPSRSFAPVAMAVAGVLLGLGTIALIVIG